MRPRAESISLFSSILAAAIACFALSRMADTGRHLGMFTDNVNLGGGLTLTHEQALGKLK